MIGVAFALQKTFGLADDVEDVAFHSTVEDFAARHGLTVETAYGKGAERREAANFRSAADLRAAFSTALGAYLLSAAEDAQLEAEFRMKAARLVTDCFVPFDDVAPTLREIVRLNVPCTALSGGWPSIDQRKADIAGFASPIIFARDLGIAANAPAAFARVAQALRLPADRIWFVGTDVRNEILPAAASGMRTIWINRDDEIFPTSRTLPDATVRSFADLLDELSESYTRGLLALRHILRTALEWRPGHFISADDPLALENRSQGEDLS